MIIILGGTSEGREIANGLRQAGYEVVLTTVSEYAGSLAEDQAVVRVGALDAASLRQLLESAEALVDATHPFATAISALAISVCAECNVPYLRFERAESALPPNVLPARDAEEAARLAVTEADGGTIFLTVGSKTLAAYLAPARAAGCRVVARVLPSVESLAECVRLGLQPRDIVAMQGPTTAEVDIALLRHYAVKVLVTKESGPTGGVLEKIAAAEAVGIPVVIVQRPRLDYPLVEHTVDALLAKLAEVCHARS